MNLRRSSAVVCGLTLLASTGIAVLTASPAQAAVCPDNNWRVADGRVRNPSFTETNINIRTGPGLNCAAIATGDPWHSVRYDCYKPGGDGHTWSHILDLSYSPAVSGWVRDDKLRDLGADVRC